MSEWIVTVEDSRAEQRLKDFLSTLPGVKYQQKAVEPISGHSFRSLDAFKQALEPLKIELPEPLRHSTFSREWIYQDDVKS